MSTVKLVIDNREHDLIKRLEGRVKVTETKMLDLADFVYRDEKDEDILVIERKTVQDLKASICDTRLREQKARLLATSPKSRILYLIEGNLNMGLNDHIQNMPVSTLVGSMINTMLRDGIKVYKTSSMEETANFLVKLYDKLVTDGDKYFNEEDHQVTSAEYSATLKKKKKANMTPEVWFICQLSSLPQVTEKIAEEITKVYPTAVSLVKAYEKTTSTNYREKLLADITYTLKTGKTRRIGDKVSKRVYQYFYGIGEGTDEIEEVCEQFSSGNNIK